MISVVLCKVPWPSRLRQNSYNEKFVIVQWALVIFLTEISGIGFYWDNKFLFLFSHGTRVPFVHIPSGQACVQKKLVKTINISEKSLVQKSLTRKSFKIQLWIALEFRKRVALKKKRAMHQFEFQCSLILETKADCQSFYSLKSTL